MNPNPTSNYKNRIFTIPNILSFFRLCLIPIFVYLYCIEKEYVYTGIILIISGITDVVDGYIARRYNMISDLGKILDPIADKLTQLAMLLCLITRFKLMIIPLVLLFLKELFMGISGLLVIKRTKIVYGALWHGKVATLLLDATMILHTFWYNIPEHISNICIIACIIMMCISCILYGMRNIKTLKENKIND